RTMSDPIAVLSGGGIEQIARPAEVYERPRTPFVAGFIGVSNLIQRDGHTITVRPEKIILVAGDEPDPPGTHAEPGRIRDVIYAGVLTRYVAELDGGGELGVSQQQTGCQVNAKYAGSSDEMVALMKNGGGGQYDMVSSSGDADLRILYAGDAHPVNVKLIPSWKDFYPAFQSPPFNTINGVHYGVS